MPRKKRDWLKKRDVFMVPPERCRLSANPRTKWDEEAFEELKDDIRARGIRDPLEGFVRDEHVDVTDGQRRLAAVSALAEEGHIIALVPLLPCSGNEADALISGAAAAATREPYHPADEVHLLELLEAKGVLDFETLRRRLPWSESKLRQRIALRRLAVPLREAFRNGEMSHNRAVQLAGIAEDEQEKALRNIRKVAAGGKTKAGKAPPKRPGKRIVRKLVDEYRETGAETLSRSDVAVVLSWMSGDGDEQSARRALGLPEAPVATGVDTRQAALPGTGDEPNGEVTQ